MDSGAWRSIACALVAVLVFASGFSEASRVQQEFSLVGTITDTYKVSLPGAAVTLTDAGDTRTAVTDDQGRFHFTGLVPGSYTVQAVLAGFRTRTRKVEIGSEPTTRLDIALHLGPLTIVDTIILTPSEYVEYASAIAHVRNGAARIPTLCPDEEEFDVLQQASVLAALKGDVGGLVELRRYRLECTVGEPVPAFERPLPPIGSEFVLLLYRMGDAVGYGTIPETTFAVQGGHVDTQGFNGLLPVMEIEAFKAALRALMR